MARSGQPARFLAGGEFPFPVVQGGVGTAVAVTIQFKPYGVKLDFTGTIDGDIIRLKIAPEVSTLDFTNAVQISGFEYPPFRPGGRKLRLICATVKVLASPACWTSAPLRYLAKCRALGISRVLGQLFRSKSISRPILSSWYW